MLDEEESMDENETQNSLKDKYFIIRLAFIQFSWLGQSYVHQVILGLNVSQQPMQKTNSALMAVTQLQQLLFHYFMQYIDAL